MKVTICTPTYNRDSCLMVLYESLRKQKCCDFEWLVIDDGSIDNTESVIMDYMNKEEKFSIKYIKKENGGKHTALNVGVANARGEYFLVVDSDDFLSDDAVETIIKCFDNVPKDYAGVAFNKMFTNGQLVGTTFKGDYLDATSLERPKHNINGDKTEVFFTKVLKNYPFPVFEGERFLPEAVVWNRIAKDGYKLRWYNKCFYYCEYQVDGLSMTVNVYNNFNGYTLYIKELNLYKETNLLEKLKNVGVYTYHAKKMNISYKEIKKSISVNGLTLVISKTLYLLKLKFSRNLRKEKLNVKE